MVICLVSVFSFAASLSVGASASSIPPSWDIVTEDFEIGNLDAWTITSAIDINLDPGAGLDGSTALSVSVSQHSSYLRQNPVHNSEEGYLNFLFNPNGLSIPDDNYSWIPGKSVRIAGVRGSDGWEDLVSLYIHNPDGQGYKAYLKWRAPGGNIFDTGEGEFGLSDSWQKITIGFRMDEWVAVWVDDDLVRQISGVSHEQTKADIIDIGKINSNPYITPSGSLLIDDVVYQVPRIDELWVDAANGDDSNDGLTPSAALRTIQKSADLAGPGTTVRILPGVYRETVRPDLSGSLDEPVHYFAENGPGTAILRGSQPASSLTWIPLTSNTIGMPPGVDPTKIYVADLSTWELDGAPPVCRGTR